MQFSVTFHCALPPQRLERRAGRKQAHGTEAMSVTSGAKRKEGGIAETVRVIFHALIIALVIRTFLFQPFNIPSGSMKETLLVGDYLFVSKYSYGYSHYSLPFSPPSVLRPHLVGHAGARRRRRVPAAEGRHHRLHQARHRPARRPHPDDRRRAPHQRRAGQARAHRRLHRDRGGRPHHARQALARDAARTA